MVPRLIAEGRAVADGLTGVETVVWANAGKAMKILAAVAMDNMDTRKESFIFKVG